VVDGDVRRRRIDDEAIGAVARHEGRHVELHELVLGDGALAVDEAGVERRLAVPRERGLAPIAVGLTVNAPAGVAVGVLLAADAEPEACARHLLSRDATDQDTDEGQLPRARVDLEDRRRAVVRARVEVVRDGVRLDRARGRMRGHSEPRGERNRRDDERETGS